MYALDALDAMIADAVSATPPIVFNTLVVCALLVPALALVYNVYSCECATPPRLRYFFVEGAIGGGKSTLLERTQTRLAALLGNERCTLVVVPEPLDLWTNVDGHNILQLFYDDPTRWAYAFQVHAMSTRVRAVRTAIERTPDGGSAPDTIVLCERSVFTDRHIFVETLHAAGTLTDAERALYVHAYDFFTSFVYAGDVGGVIYMRTSPEMCAEHIRLRDRTEEAAVKIDYLRTLHESHEAAIARSDTWAGAPRLIVDVRTELANLPSDDAVADSAAQRLYEFIIKDAARV